MSTPAVERITSRDNAFLKDLRRLAHDNTAYRKTGRCWVEGEHLCSAALQRGIKPVLAVFSEKTWSLASSEYTQIAPKNIVLSDAMFASISPLESPVGLGFVVGLEQNAALQPGVASVILDRVQDAGNVGSILRSAGAFGFQQIIALQGTAALWGSKVLRAGMGAHFGLTLFEGLSVDALDVLDIPLVVTSSHQGKFLQNLNVPTPCAWVMGHEGQGVCETLIKRASHFARIHQPGGEESLNVAAAAAICLHASAVARCA